MIEGGKIVLLGRWIVKFFFELNLGVFVYDLIDYNVGLEGIIIVVFCIVLGFLFYRGGIKI